MIPFPIRDENPSASEKIYLIPLIAVNVAVFAWELATPTPLKEIFRLWGFVPRVAGLEMARWITSQFLHAGVLHILGNMWFLWIFGDNVEGRFREWFLPFYLLAGIGANMCDLAFRPASTIPGVGASGAISGVLGAYFVLFPTARLECLWFFGVFWRRISMAASTYGLIYVGVQVVMQLLTPRGGVNYAAHLGGVVFGAAAAVLIRAAPQEAVPLSGPSGQFPQPPPLDHDSLEGLTRADPAHAVAGYLARLRTDPYFACGTPESQLWMSRRLSQAGYPQLARNALGRLLLRHPTTPLRPVACLELARLEEDWFGDLPAAREHLENALAGRGTLDGDQVADAQDRLRKVQAVLARTFLEEPAEGEIYWVLRESVEPLSGPQVRALADRLGASVPETVSRLVQDGGILARNLRRAEAAALADEMERRGVPVIVLPQKMILLLPPAERATVLRIREDAFDAVLADGSTVAVPWGRCLLIAAASVGNKTGFGHVIELVSLDPLRRLRWQDTGGDRELYFSVLQDLVLKARHVPLNPGAVNAWEDQLPPGCDFADSAALDRDLTWQIQIAYQRKEGIYRNV